MYAVQSGFGKGGKRLSNKYKRLNHQHKCPILVYTGDMELIAKFKRDLTQALNAHIPQVYSAQHFS